MKVLKRIKLNELSNIEMDNSEMSQVRGGEETLACGCGCNYKDEGGASTIDNHSANLSNGYSQSAGGNNACTTWYDTDNDGTEDKFITENHF